MNLQFLKETASKINLQEVANKVMDVATSSLKPTNSSNVEVVDAEEVSEAEMEEKGSKMLEIMEWAFEKANGNIPGLGTTQEMAQNYLEKYGSVSAAIDKVVNWQIAAAATAGFVTGLGGLAVMPLSLPANLASTMAIQLRMIGVIAELGGFHENTEEKRTGMYLCLLGSQAGDVISQTTSQFAVKFATASLKKLPRSFLNKINKWVSFKLFTKFGKTGLINIHKVIPVLGGVVGGSIDAFSTYAIAKAAKSLFLDEILESEKQEKLDMDKMHLLINLARVDNNYEDAEKLLLKTIAGSLSFSPNALKAIMLDIDNPKKYDVDLTPFKEDMMLSTSTLSGLFQVANIGGISPVEKIYINRLSTEMGMSTEDLKLIMTEGN